MSTKSSIVYGNSFHLYKECFDEENVYLELESVEFNASNNQVTVTIPVAIWEVIRAYGAVDLSYANYSDAEIETIVEEEVDRRMEKYRSTKDERARKFASLSGSICYGSAELPKNEQIENGVRYYRQVRERQLAIKNQIEAIEKLNQSSS
ncbi:MAG: hypothetical protein AAFQ14_02475 [Cyanobacteria bacterium J06621_12]